jgi:uncharacterized membrane protein YfcA
MENFTFATLLGHPAALGALGMAVGTLGTLVGAGGGFILVPLLLLMMPLESPDRLTAISLAAIFANSFSGTIAYAAMKRIHYRTGLQFAAAAIPGALMGAWAISFVPRQVFNVVFSCVLIAIAIFLLKRSGSHPRTEPQHKHTPHQPNPGASLLGALISLIVGFVSSILGIGGGIVHVPALTYVLGYRLHHAISTSHFVLVCTSFVAVVEHFVRGSYEGQYAVTGAIAVGAVVGAQFGARLSSRVNERTVLRILGIALILAAARIFLMRII